MARFEKRWLLLVVPTALTLATIFAAYDIAIAEFTYNYPLPRVVLRILEINAYFVSNGFGVLVVLLGLLLLRQIRFRQLTYLVSASLGSGIFADILKLCVCRSRPNVVSLSTASFASTFHGFFPFLTAGSHGQSFPSGHAAVAAGLATSLSVTFPRWRWLVVPLGVAAAFSRVALHVHFPTDVLVGATLGICWTLACHPRRIEMLLESVRSKRKNAVSILLRVRPSFAEGSIAKLDAPQSALLESSDQSRAA